MTHKEAYEKLATMLAIANELYAAQVAPYPIDGIRGKIKQEIAWAIVRAGIDATGAKESLQFVGENLR